MQKLLVGFLFVCTLAGFSSLTSCKKDSKGATTEEKIAGKWSFEAMYFDYHVLGTSQKDTSAGTPGNFIEFHSDGTITDSEDGQVSTGTWSFAENKLVISKTGDEETPVSYDIKKLTDSELQIYHKEIEGEDYFEITIHFKK